MHHKTRNKHRGRLFALALVIVMLFSNTVAATATATELNSVQPHDHQWATAWSYDETHHWHDCEEADCSAKDAEKDGYEKHILADDGVCTECQYASPDYSETEADNNTTASALTGETVTDGETDPENSENGEDKDDLPDDEDEDSQGDSEEGSEELPEGSEEDSEEGSGIPEDSDDENGTATDTEKGEKNDEDDENGEDDNLLEDEVAEEENLLADDPLAVVTDSDELLTEELETAQIAVQADLVIDIPDVSPPTTYQEVYDRMMAMQAILPDGTPWDDNTPYGSLGPLGEDYVWKGGPIDGATIHHTGCAAFGAVISDAAFGNLPGRKYKNGSFTFDDVRPGDILRRKNHTVIVLQKGAGGVIVAEGNLSDLSAGVPGTVHWGRAIPDWEVTDSTYMITRYPENFVSADEEGANEELDSGSLGSVQWSLTKAGALTISGNGSIPDFSADNLAPWFAHNAKISSIEIQSGITGIGDYAFYQSSAMSVTIGGSVSSIGTNAFNASKIIEVTIPGSVQSIDDGAFGDCQNLVTLSLSEGLSSIGENAFSGCVKLRTVCLPSTITTVKTGAFKDCREIWLATFAASNQKVTIGDDIFSRCWALESVTLPLKAGCIGGGMFGSCGILTELFIPSGIEWIKSNDSLSGSPFIGCDALKTINYEGSESEWNSIGGPNAMLYGGRVDKTTVNFNASATETPSGHQHVWSTTWEYNNDYHWHECTVENCPLTDDSQKGSYGAHTGEWIIEKDATADQAGSKYRECTACKFRQTEVIAATGNGSSTGEGDTGSTDTGTSTGTNTGNTESGGASSNTEVNKPNQPNASDSENTTNNNNSTGSALISSIENSSNQNLVTNSSASLTSENSTSVNSALDALLNASGLNNATKPADSDLSSLNLSPKPDASKQTNKAEQQINDSSSTPDNEDEKSVDGQNDSEQITSEENEDTKSAQDVQNVQGQSITDSGAKTSKSLSDIFLLGVTLCGGATIAGACLYQFAHGKIKTRFNSDKLDDDAIEDLDKDSEDE